MFAELVPQSLSNRATYQRMTHGCTHTSLTHLSTTASAILSQCNPRLVKKFVKEGEQELRYSAHLAARNGQTCRYLRNIPSVEFVFIIRIGSGLTRKLRRQKVCREGHAMRSLVSVKKLVAWNVKPSSQTMTAPFSSKRSYSLPLEIQRRSNDNNSALSMRTSYTVFLATFREIKAKQPPKYNRKNI